MLIYFVSHKKTENGFCLRHFTACFSNIGYGSKQFAGDGPKDSLAAWMDIENAKSMLSATKHGSKSLERHEARHRMMMMMMMRRRRRMMMMMMEMKRGAR